MCDRSPEIRAALDRLDTAIDEGDDAVAALRDEYEAASLSRPDDPTPHYLLGELLAKRRDPAAGASFARALEIDPGFAWARYGLLRHHGRYDRDPGKIVEQLGALTAACPDFLEAYWYVDHVRDREAGRAIAGRFRKAVERRETIRSSYRLKLWKAELRHASTEDIGAARARVAEELKALENESGSSKEDDLEALLEGYAAIGDDEGIARTRERWLAAFPDSERSKRIVLDGWHEAHPWPGGDLNGEAMQAYATALYEASGEWTARWPDDAEMWRNRFDAVGIRLGSTEEEIVRTAERLMEVYEAGTTWRTTPPLPILVARTLVRRGAGLDRVPALIDRGIEMADERRSRLAGDVPRDDAERRERQVGPFLDRIEAEFLRFDGLLKQGDHEGAHKAVDEVEGLLDRVAPGPEDSEIHELVYGRLTRDWWERRAWLADAEGSHMDALLYLQTALVVDPDGPEVTEGLSLRVNARDYFLGRGGSESAWDDWMAAGARVGASLVAPEALWATDPRPLPEFELTDLTGRRWRNDDIRGKVVVLALWATWCGPCKWELPVLEKLHAEYRDAEHVVVLSLNVDEETYLVEPFVEKAGYTFPVLLAAEYDERYALSNGLPTTLLLDGEGVIRRQSRGFAANEDERWREVLRRMVDELRGSAATP